MNRVSCITGCAEEDAELAKRGGEGENEEKRSEKRCESCGKHPLRQC